MLVLGCAEAAGIAVAEFRPPAKACEEYSAMGQTRFAPIALRTNATLIMLKSAKNNRAYGKKHRRIMNSVCRPKYKKGLDDRFSAWVCHIFRSCSGRSAARRCLSQPQTMKIPIAPNSSSPPHTRYILDPELLHKPRVMPKKRNT